MNLTAVHHFEVDGLWVQADMLGRSDNFRTSGHQCIVRYPSHAGDFGLDRYQGIGESAISGHNTTKNGVVLACEIRMLRVEIETEGSLTAAQFPSGGPHPAELVEEGLEILQRTANIARKLIGSYLLLVRTRHGQHWLGPSVRAPRVTWISSLLDSDGNRVPLGYGDPLGPVMVRSAADAIAADDGRGLALSIENGETPTLDEILLSDARYYGWSAEDGNLRVAVLLAAIACEIKVKSLMSERAGPDQRALVELILENPRDVSLAAASLFDKGLRSLIGRSMKDDDRGLHKHVVTLFAHRNMLAHRGGLSLTSTELRADLQTAQRAIRWLNGI